MPNSAWNEKVLFVRQTPEQCHCTKQLPLLCGGEFFPYRIIEKIVAGRAGPLDQGARCRRKRKDRLAAIARILFALYQLGLGKGRYDSSHRLRTHAMLFGELCHGQGTPRVEASQGQDLRRRQVTGPRGAHVTPELSNQNAQVSGKLMRQRLSCKSLCHQVALPNSKPCWLFLHIVPDFA